MATTKQTNTTAPVAPAKKQGPIGALFSIFTRGAPEVATLAVTTLKVGNVNMDTALNMSIEYNLDSKIDLVTKIGEYQRELQSQNLTAQSVEDILAEFKK